jgi:nucleolar complex protein 3
MSVETGYIKGRLKELRALHKGHLHGMDDVLSNMEKEVDIFIDLIPGYKIQKKQEDEDKAVHAKTTRVVIDIEDEILSKYEKFLNYLLKMRKATVQTLQTQAYECITKLLSSASHFNFASSLISACVSGINEKNEAAARMCVEAIEELLDNDASGECSLKVLELTINQVKAKMQTLNPALIAALIRLRISAVDVERKTHEQRKRERDLKKPMNNDDKLIQRSLDKADATPDQAHRKRTMTYVLQRLMAAYLRVLEAAQDANGIRQHRLLVPVLEGLTKFAPLLDIRMLNLLLTAIKDVLELSNTHALTTLNAIVACATLTECAEMASVQTNTAGDEFTSSAVAVDFGPAYKHLYRIIPEIWCRFVVSVRRP